MNALIYSLDQPAPNFWIRKYSFLACTCTYTCTFYSVWTPFLSMILKCIVIRYDWDYRRIVKYYMYRKNITCTNLQSGEDTMGIRMRQLCIPHCVFLFFHFTGKTYKLTQITTITQEDYKNTLAWPTLYGRAINIIINTHKPAVKQKKKTLRNGILLW